MASPVTSPVVRRTRAPRGGEAADGSSVFTALWGKDDRWRFLFLHQAGTGFPPPSLQLQRRPVLTRCPLETTVLTMKTCAWPALVLAALSLSVQAQVLHRAVDLTACLSNDTESQALGQLDGDQMFFVDLELRQAVLTLPPFADPFALGPDSVAQALASRQLCRNNLATAARAEGFPPETAEPPVAMVYPKSVVRPGEPNTLICSAQRYYPFPLGLAWARNGEPVAGTTPQTLSLVRRDATYSCYSLLPFSPRPGDVYTCHLQHRALRRPLVVAWEVPPEARPGAVLTVVCGVAMALGMLGVVTGCLLFCSAHPAGLSMSPVLVSLWVQLLVGGPWGRPGVEGYAYESLEICEFDPSNLTGLVYIHSQVFNRLEYLRYDSRVQRFEGYTRFGIANAQRFNRDPGVMATMLANRDHYCVPNARLFNSSILNKTVAPAVSITALGGGADGSLVLVCHATGFYPPRISVTWLRGGGAAPGGSSGLLPDGDWLYQTHAFLEPGPRPAEQLSCIVEHRSLAQPLVVPWEPPTAPPDWRLVATALWALSLGLVLSLAGAASRWGRSSKQTGGRVAARIAAVLKGRLRPAALGAW
ncbi:uncharacterized protein [Lepisosteus oculatus]|uniref:uncharacterized protein isoform X2 n=1 Tax=Lepisosteus oculatus TaxID=7918 RepID=UPI0035F52985